MRRFLLLSALLLGALSPTAALALSEECTTVLETTPVSSHYVQKIIERADKGLEYAASAKASSDFSVYLPSWSRRILSAFIQLVDSQNRVTTSRDSLLSMSACLHTDVLILSCKIEQVRDKLHEELSRGSTLGLLRLESLLDFLNERTTQLIRGAHDGTYTDPTWGVQRAFDKEKPENPDRPICPFHSDYGPAAMNGYGCEEEVLEPRSAIPTVGEELAGLRDVRERLDDFKEASQEFLEVQRQLESIFTPQNSSLNRTQELPKDPAHTAVFNCIEKRPASYCSNNRQKQCASDGECGSGICLPGNQYTGLERELRGPFSLPKNHIELLAEFVRQRIAEGFSRENVDDLKLAQEFAEEKSAQRSIREQDSVFAQLLRNAARLFFRKWSELQGRDESGVFAQATDAQLEIAASLADMRGAISDLAKLASRRDGVRSFVIRYAYFLRRSCIYRPCSKTLEQILKISYENTCFPYTDGEFLRDSPTSPRWRKCAQAAELEIE